MNTVQDADADADADANDDADMQQDIYIQPIRTTTYYLSAASHLDSVNSRQTLREMTSVKVYPTVPA